MRRVRPIRGAPPPCSRPHEEWIGLARRTTGVPQARLPTSGRSERRRDPADPSPLVRTRSRSDLLDQRLLEEVEVLQGEARPERDTVERVLGDVAGDARDLREETVDVAEERAAAGHHHPLVDDVGAQLRRRLLQDAADRLDQLLEWELDRLHDLGAGDRDRARQAGDQVASPDLHLELALERQGRPDRDLDLLGGPVADHQVVLLADVRRDRLVEAVAADPEAVADDDPAERDHRDLAGPAADVDDHVPGRSADRDVRPDRRGEGLLDQVRLAGTGLEGRVANRALLDGGDPGRDADHHLRPRQRERALPGAADEVAEHRLGDDVIGDHAVLHRPDGGDVAGGPADHLASLLPDRDDAVVVGDRDDGWLLDDDALALDVDDDVGRAEVDADLHGVGVLTGSGRRSIRAPRSWNLRSMFS